MSLSYPYLLRKLAVEEYRLHANLFGGRRFALFPLFVAGVAAGAATFFATGGTDAAALVAGLHLLVGAMGLHVGTVGLVGRDALENLLGDTTLLLFSARTLPVSQRRLLLAFLVKDVGYYAALFVAPLVVGLVPLAALGGLSAARLPLVFLTTAWTFSVGVAASLALVALYTRSRPVALGVLLAVAAGIVLRGPALVALSPYGLLTGGGPGTLLASVALVVVPAAVGVALFDVSRRTPARTAGNRFRRLHGALDGHDPQGVLAKSLLDVHRSSGGVVKLLFSQGLVFAVVAGLLAYLPSVVPVRPSPGLALSAILALGSFTTYNWLCQFEDGAFYGTYPVALPTVFRAKFVAFTLLALPVGLGYLALGAVVFGAESLLVGFVCFPLLAVYVFGVTAYVAGLRPTELLFDTPVFALFSVAMMAALLPLVVAAIAYPVAPLAVGGVAVGVSAVAAGVGYGLYRKAGPRWAGRVRASGS